MILTQSTIVVTQIIQAATIALATLGTGAATMSVMNEDIPDMQVPEGAWVSDGALDGRAFTVYGTDIGSGARAAACYPLSLYRAGN